MAELRALWNIGEESFRTLVKVRMRSEPPPATVNGQRDLPMLGDDLILDAGRTLMRWTPIDASPRDVWPWLAQMLRGGGIYGWPALESPGCRSADYPVEGLPEPRVGDRVGDVLEIAGVDPGREIVWRAPTGLRYMGFGMRSLTIDYLLRPASPDRCELLVRMRGTCEPLTSQVCGYLFEVLDFVLPASQLALLRDLIESYERRAAVGDLNRRCVERHQAAAFMPAGAHV